MEPDHPSDIEDLQRWLRKFAAERDWEQFHNPKNLIMALTGELGELSEIFQWLTPAQATDVMTDPNSGARVREALADVFGHVLRLADVLDVDLPEALHRKGWNSEKYPIETSRDSAKNRAEMGTQANVDVIAVDWSGRERDGERYIWMAKAAGQRLVGLETGRTRADLIREIVALRDQSPDGLTVGFDFAFSFPAWFVEQLGCSSVYELWSTVAANGESWLSECQPPFWGRAGKVRPDLVSHHRITELGLKVGDITPKSVFQIGGAGAVGTGSIRGMPFLRTLHDEGFSIWPFDPPSPWNVVEIYPRLLTGSVVKSDLDERRKYLHNKHWDIDSDDLRLAEGSEDAFDSVASAMVMSRHGEELRSLGRSTDPVTLLEGEIWRTATA